MKNLRMMVIAAAIALVAMVATAQNSTQVAQIVTPAVSGPSFTGASGPCAIRIYGAASVCSNTTESLDFIDWGKTKDNHLFVESQQILAPTPGLSLYVGDLRYQPNITKWLKPTNVTPANLSVSFDLGGGSGVPATGPARFTFIAGGQLQYKATTSLTWNPVKLEYVRLGDNNAMVYTMQLRWLFGPKQ